MAGRQTDWARKLTGKPVAFTLPDCEFESRRVHSIYVIRIPFETIYCKLFLAHTVAPKPEAFIAASIGFFSSAVKRTDSAGARCLCFAIDGLPAFLVIK